jgi:hypothetical protein
MQNKLGLSSENNTDSLREDLDRIEIILNSIEAQEKMIKERIVNQINSEPDISVAPNFLQIKSQTLELLNKYGMIDTPTLSKLIGINEGIMFSICSQLKRDNLIELSEKFEWQIK